MEIKYYALHDNDPHYKKCGTIPISLENAQQYNKRGYGIYWTVNEYVGRRRIQNLTHLNYWFVDIDGGDKRQQMDNIETLPLQPSMIVESKNGYHCYWQIADECSLEDFRKIEKGLTLRLNGDPHCTDPLRLLRVPYFLHQKDVHDVFRINVIRKNNKAYTTDKMLYVYGVEEKIVRKKPPKGSLKDFCDESKWEKLFKVSTIGKGSRNATFARYIFWLKDLGLQDCASYIINGLNKRISDPLPQYEIDALLRTKGCY